MRIRLNIFLVRSGLLLIAAAAVGAAFILGEPRSTVAWRPLRAVVLESDDWGFAGFIPEPEAWSGLARQELATGLFPAVYWQSTLEDSLCVVNLCDLLASYKGRDGLPPAIQANYIMSSLAWTEDQGWSRYDLPEFPEAYQRPGLWTAVSRGIARGVWRPEFHGTWHYDPQLRRNLALSSQLAREITRRGIVLFPESERAWELGSWRPASELAAELDQSLETFRALFHRPPVSVVAPDYTWNSRVESLWESRGLVVIQGKREQRSPVFRGGLLGRLGKFLGRRWDQAFHRNRHYLERNCRLETVQSPDPGLAVQACLTAVWKAWSDNQPAVVETHRVNYCHTDPQVVRRGLAGLGSFLEQVQAAPAGPPVFLVDAEMAQLNSNGTSACVRGEKLVLRNGTHSRKLVAVPEARSGGGRGSDFWALGPGQELILDLAAE